MKNFDLVFDAKATNINCKGVNNVLINHFNESMVDAFETGVIYGLSIKINNSTFNRGSHDNGHNSLVFYNLRFNYYDPTTLEDLYGFLCDQACICYKNKYINLRDLEAINLNLMGVYPSVNTEIYLDVDINFNGLSIG
jgi:hypothetical protein